MIDFAFVVFAFIAGVVAFFAPCSVVLFPGYVSYYLNKGEEEKLNFMEKSWKGIRFGFFTILGFFTVYGISGLLIILFGQFIKRFIPWIAILFGVALIIFGIFMLFGKSVSVKIGFLRFKSEKPGLYLFGITYGISSLGCVFPIFLPIMLQSLSGGNIIESIIPLIVYILGISIVMLIATLLIIFARAFITQKLHKILPYINYISAVILIIAGGYMIYYQYVLFS